jgi:peptide/nickel transport system permease protein
MAVTRSEHPTDGLDPGGDGSGGRRAVIRERRRATRARVWASYRTSAMGMAGLIILIAFVLMAILAPLFVDPADLDVTRVTGPRLAEPSLAYPMGTDDAGRSVLDLVIWGSRISLFVGSLAAIVSMAVGSTIGIVAGYKGGLWDRSLMTFTDWLLVLPLIPLLIVLSGVLGRSLLVIIFVIGLSSWPWTARLVRSQTLSVKERPYIERARGLGAHDRQLITRHVLPNVFPVIFANTILQVALMILLESTLSFLGLGDPTSVSWGSTLEKANAAGAPTLGAWWWIGFPGLCIVLVVLAFTMCGNALEEIVNPRLRER